MKTRLLSAFVLVVALCLLLGLATAGVRASPGTLYVKVGGTDSGDCTSTPCASVGYALTKAFPGDTIKVAQGTCTENITIDKNVALEGGYESTGWTRDIEAYETIIDGNLSGTVVTFQAGSDGAVLDGFTITGGDSSDGGGIYIEQTSPTVSNCTIFGNRASNGAGLAVYDAATPLIVDNAIVSNTATWAGGGIRVIASGGTIQNNRILSNTAQGWAGGAMEIAVDASTTVVSNSIVGNIADTGGGIAVNWYCTVTITGNEIVSNRTTDGGGGGVWVNDYSTAIVDRNEVAKNRVSEGSGGGIAIANGSVVTVTNNVIASNIGLSMAWDGDGIAIWDEGSDARIINNTIASNSAEGIQANQGTVLARNNIIYGNDGGIHNYQSGATMSSDHNAFWDNGWDYGNVSPGPGDISVDPLFVDAAAGDYHLLPDSLCIDRGTNTGAPSTDFEGDLRPLDGDGDGTATVDMGADEYVLTNLVTNGSFEQGPRIPASWKGTKLTLKDRRVCKTAHDGRCSFRMVGTTAKKSLRQVVTISGSAGDSITLSGWSKARNPLRTGGPYCLQAKVFHTDGTKKTYRKCFAKKTHGWQRRKTTFRTVKEYKKIVVYLLYYKQGGKAWFDDVGLVAQ